MSGVNHPKSLASVSSSDRESSGLASDAGSQLGKHTGRLSKTPSNTNSENAFYEWCDQCECPKGTTMETCNCKRYKAHYLWRTKCTCSAFDMGKCKCGTCEPKFDDALRAVASRQYEKDCTCETGSMDDCVCGAVEPEMKRRRV